MSPEEFIRGTLEIGTVYYYQSDKLIGTSKPHFYVVLSKDDEQAILLVCASTQIEKRKRFVESRSISPETLVIVAPNEESFLTETSVFDCNSIHVESILSLARIHARRPIQCKGKASAALLRRLMNGVLKSPQVVKKYQDVLRRQT